MELRTELTYPGATPAQVVALAFDPEFRRAVCRATAAVEYDVDVSTRADGSTRVTVSRTLPAAVPDFAKRFVGETIQIVQEETWTGDGAAGRYDAVLSIRFTGQPASLRGSMRIEPSAGGAVEVVEGDVRVSMPLIGRKFEEELAKGIVSAAQREQQLGREWLARPDDPRR